MRSLRLLVAALGLARAALADPVWIDTDVSIGSPIREVDDAYALVLAFHSPEIRIGGISASYGNAPLGHTLGAARRLVREFGAAAKLRPEQVFAGATSARDRGRRTDAGAALAEFTEKTSVTYIALGPLTNLAAFLQLYPEGARRIERVIFVGGQIEGDTMAFGPNRTFRIHDANVSKDPVATQVVLRSGIPITLAPVATSAHLTLSRTEMDQLARTGGAGRHLAGRSKIWLWFWTKIVREEGGPIFDALAVAIAATPNLVSTERRYAIMESGNLIVSRRRMQSVRPVRVCTGFKPKLKRVLVERVSK